MFQGRTAACHDANIGGGDDRLSRHYWGIPLPHAAALILIWILLVIAVQSAQATRLLAIGIPLLLFSLALSSARLFQLLRRTRWILLSLLFIYAYATPGHAIWPFLAQFSPTVEGIIDGAQQLGRLVFVLAGLSLLLSLLPRQQLISGLYGLTYPLQYLGWSRTRFAVRLALTLHYAEAVLMDTDVNWHESVEKMMAPVEVQQQSIELQSTPFTRRDGLLLVICCTFFLLVLA